MPDDLIREAALAWLKQQDLSQKTPVETYEMLTQAIRAITDAQPDPQTKIGF